MASSRLFKDAKSFRQEVFDDLSAVLAHPDDLAKVPAMLADAQEKQVATGGALSELIAMHCSQLRQGLEELVAALADVDTVKKRLVIIQELCKRSDVLAPGESAHAATLSTVQTNILRTIGGVDNIHRFPARAQDAAALLRDVDGDPAALLDVFHDLSALLATQSVAHRLIETMKAHASVSQSEEMAKVETYFGQVQRVNAAFTSKVLSYFDDVLSSARTCPRHLVMALRVVLNQEAAWALIEAKGGEKAAAAAAPDGGNPWGVLYREEAVRRIERSAERAMRPALLEADRVFGQWMHVHGRTAASFFSDAQARRRTADAAAAAASGGGPDSPDGPDTARAAPTPGHRARAMRGSVAAVQSRVVAKLIGGVTRAPIQLTGMAAPVEAAPETEEWLEGVQVDEEAVDAMQATLAHADEIVGTLVAVYDEALPCFPPQLSPVQTQAKVFSDAASTMLDALGQAAASFDNAGLLALLGWMDAYRSTLVGLGLPDDAIHISTVPRVKTPRGEAVPMHGVDVARLVYIDRIRRQLGKAFSNLAESDLLQEPEPDGEGRLWTPGVIEMFRFLTQQVELAASVRDAEVVRNVASVALQVMQSYQGLVLSAMMEGDTKRGGKKLDFNMLVAVVNNSLIAYDQARDLASVIDAAIRANNDRGGEGEGGARRSTADSDGGLLDDSEIHVEMEECNRGFLNVSKVALDKVVQSIFEDQGTSDVLRALFKGADWCNGVTTHSVLLTLADYLSDLESWLDPPFYRRACQKCLKDTVHEFRVAFMRQMPSNSLREAEMERLDTDISDLRDFFLRYLAPEKVDAGLEALEAVQKLCQCESVDEFEETFGFMLMDESCSVRPKDVALVCAKRPDIDGGDAATIEAGCERQYQQWLAGQKGRGGGSPRREDGYGGDGDRDGGALQRLYQRVVKAVGADASE